MEFSQMIVGVPKETAALERRVSIAPETVSKLGAGVSVLVEKGAGEGAGFPDSEYTAAGATMANDAQSLYAQADVVLKVSPFTPDEASWVKEGATTISFLYPVANIDAVKKLMARKATAFAMELIPRISRAQPMDALSSQANIAGYKAVLLAADTVPKLFPLMMTAAGTISPAKVFILGAGVAGLQAIATAKRLGAVVEAYDVRPVVKEQVMSLGAKFAEMPVEAKDAQDAGGYAKAMGEEFTRKQQEFLAQRAKPMDVVITTALIPGARAPILITEEAVKGMHPGSVIVDLAAEAKGNCAITEPGKTVVKYGVTIHGPLNLPSTMAPEASRLYSKNISGLLQLMLKDGKLAIDTKDEVVKGSMVLNAGQVVHMPTLKVIDPAAAAAMAAASAPPAAPASSAPPPAGAKKP
ncbi:MAG TPA: Re/Si-specific NAD(P)(+) transhydrogenase subunit alpha [Nitrososphaerales archaeon]|nr:Re/Si-specific NAD(P)(+) transhydrogenase subunit alpha [Nitrososphaerales archaeon]